MCSCPFYNTISLCCRIFHRPGTSRTGKSLRVVSGAPKARQWPKSSRAVTMPWPHPHPGHAMAPPCLLTAAPQPPHAAPSPREGVPGEARGAPLLKGLSPTLARALVAFAPACDLEHPRGCSLWAQQPGWERCPAPADFGLAAADVCLSPPQAALLFGTVLTATEPFAG